MLEKVCTSRVGAGLAVAALGYGGACYSGFWERRASVSPEGLIGPAGFFAAFDPKQRDRTLFPRGADTSSRTDAAVFDA